MKINSNLLMGIFFIMILSGIFVILMPLVNSGSEVINTFLVYEDSASSTSKTVTQGDVFNVVMVAYGHGEALQNERLELVDSTLIFQEAVSGDKIDTYTWLYTKTYTLNTGILTPGTYTLRFTAKTATTQSVEYSDLQLTILSKEIPDTTKPIVDVTYPTATTYTSQRTNLIFSVFDDNLKSCTYSLNGAIPVNVNSLVNGINTITGISSVEGINTWTVTCKDYSGNTGTDSVTFNVIIPDTTKPIVDVTYPTATTYTSHRTSLTFNVYDDNLKSCTYKLNNENPIEIQVNNGLNALGGITSVEGINTWTVTCKDYSGNTGTDSVTFNIVLPNPPICGDGKCNGDENCSTCPQDCGICPTTCDLTQAYWSVSSALNGQVVSLNTKGTNCDGKTINFAVYQDIANGDVYVTNTATAIISNGIASSNWVAVAPSEHNGDITPRYYFIAKVLGETESATSGYLLVTTPSNTTKPIVDVTYPTATTYTSQRTNLIFSVFDDNLKYCTYSLNGATPVNVNSLVNGINTITGITSVTGTNTWTVTCKDYSGNTGTDSVTFNVVLPNPPICGDGKCNGDENCSTCPQDCGICPTNCTICKDSKPLDDSGYDYLSYLNKKTTFIIEETETKNVEKEKTLLKDNPILISLILILGILMLLLVIAIVKIIKRKN